MTNLKNKFVDFKDNVGDVFEKVSSTSSRAGNSIERIGKLVEADIPKDIVATLMTRNSTNGHEYTVQDIDSYTKMYEESKTKVAITLSQSTALLRDAKQQDEDAYYKKMRESAESYRASVKEIFGT